MVFNGHGLIQLQNISIVLIEIFSIKYVQWRCEFSEFSDAKRKEEKILENDK